MRYIWQFGDFDSIAKLNVRQPTLIIVTCIMSISQKIYTQYHPVSQTKCSSICLVLQFAKLNDRQLYYVYGSYYTYYHDYYLKFLQELLGRGQFGDVRRAKWNGSLVAVKEFQSADARCGFWDEVSYN